MGLGETSIDRAARRILLRLLGRLRGWPNRGRRGRSG